MASLTPEKKQALREQIERSLRRAVILAGRISILTPDSDGPDVQFHETLSEVHRGYRSTVAQERKRMTPVTT